MKRLIDNTGRFPFRPFYDEVELDAECEHLVSEFLISRHGFVQFPMSTDDLQVMIERDVADLDFGTDLSVYGSGIEGITELFPNQKPRVQIDSELVNNPIYVNRLRTTLTHEYAHVKYHDPLVKLIVKSRAQRAKFASFEPILCHRGSIAGAQQTDWLEWQAGYCSGAMLMPKTHVLKIAGDIGKSSSLKFPFSHSSPAATRTVNAVMEMFIVSQRAAEVRLSVLNVTN